MRRGVAQGRLNGTETKVRGKHKLEALKGETGKKHRWTGEGSGYAGKKQRQGKAGEVG